jgi:hypothetical protein
MTIVVPTVTVGIPMATVVVPTLSVVAFSMSSLGLFAPHPPPTLAWGQVEASGRPVTGRTFR